MLLYDTCNIGDKDNPAPFEGDLALWLRSLPTGAKVTRATIQLEPTPYQETIDLTPNTPTRGVTTVPSPPNSASFVEVNFHARRTLVAVAGTGGDATLQVDMGGTFVSIANDGSIFAPTKTELKIPFPAAAPAAEKLLPGLTVSKFRLSLAAGTLTVTNVTISSVPTNVSVRLGQLPAFWTHLGELAVADTSPDFALVFNTFLATVQPQNGFYTIPFVIHSDTLAQLKATIQVEYVIDQPVLPSYLPDITMSYAFNPQPDVDTSLTTVKLPKSAVPVTTATNARVRGDFQPTRVAQESVEASSTVANVLVSPNSSLAQPFRLDGDIALTGVDLPLSKALPGLAGLSIAVHADNDGKPSGQVLVRVDLVVGKPLPDQSVWGSATLPAPFPLAKQDPNQASSQGQVYWLVLESLVGQASWIAAPASSSDLALQYSYDNGLSWRPANAQEALAPLSAQFRLRNVPNHFTIPIQLDIGQKPGDVRRRLDEFAPLGRVELTFGFGDALAQHLANLTTSSQAQCGSEDLVINGNFSDPLPDDAAMKLFGVEYKQGGDSFSPTVTLGPRTDLSVQRFVTLSLDNSPPSVQPTRIDCAGANPAQTTPDEIVNAIKAKIDPTAVTLANNNQLNLDRVAVLYPWSKKQVPSGWQGTANQTFRLKIPDGSNRTVVLLADPASLDQSKSPNQSEALIIDQWDISYACFPLGVPAGSTTDSGEASLSQRIPVAAGCRYQLEINFLFVQFDLPDIDASVVPAWQVTWLDSNDNVLRTDGETFSQRLTNDELNTPLSPVDALLSAPPKAVNADLSFINSASDAYALVIEMVSFTPTQQSLRNSSFLQWADNTPDGSPATRAIDRSPAGWTLKSGLLGSEIDSQGNQRVGVQLQGNGSDDTVLSQLVDITAGDTYELRVRAQPVPPVKGDPGTLPPLQRARLELQWLSNGQPGDVAILTLDGQNFSESAWTGIAPATATQGEIRLIQPKGSKDAQNNLLVESVKLEEVELVSVPLVFLSEAPGQLTVSQMRVAYDVPVAPKSPRRASIAATNGSGGTKNAVTQAVAISDSKAGSVMMPTPQPQPQPTTIPDAGTTAATAPAPQAPPAQQAPAASTLSLTSIPGIGEARALQLEASGIDSLEKLAAAAPEDIVQTLKGVKVDLAARFIADAKQLLAAPPQPGTT